MNLTYLKTNILISDKNKICYNIFPRTTIPISEQKKQTKVETKKVTETTRTTTITEYLQINTKTNANIIINECQFSTETEKENVHIHEKISAKNNNKIDKKGEAKKIHQDL